MSKSLFTISIRSLKGLSEIISELIFAIDFLPSIYTEPDKKIGCVSVYFETQKEAETAKIQIDKILKNTKDLIPAKEYEISINEIQKDDWETSWKEFFHSKRIGNNLIIKPPWEDFPVEKNDVVIEIDPEMSFGTGTHGTTQACLEFIEKTAEEIPGATFLDIGTGSGILSIAAAKLGFSEIDAFDNSQESLKAIENNIHLNPTGIRRSSPSRHRRVFDKGDCRMNSVKINYFVADLTTYKSVNKYDVVAANILSSVLIDNAAAICSAVKSGGKLILSGILTEQYPKVLETFSSFCLTEKETKTINGWKTGVFNH